MHQCFPQLKHQCFPLPCSSPSPTVSVQLSSTLCHLPLDHRQDHALGPTSSLKNPLLKIHSPKAKTGYNKHVSEKIILLPMCYLIPIRNAIFSEEDDIQDESLDIMTESTRESPIITTIITSDVSIHDSHPIRPPLMCYNYINIYNEMFSKLSPFQTSIIQRLIRREISKRQYMVIQRSLTETIRTILSSGLQVDDTYHPIRLPMLRDVKERLHDQIVRISTTIVDRVEIPRRRGDEGVKTLTYRWYTLYKSPITRLILEYFPCLSHISPYQKISNVAAPLVNTDEPYMKLGCLESIKEKEVLEFIRKFEDLVERRPSVKLPCLSRIIHQLLDTVDPKDPLNEDIIVKTLLDNVLLSRFRTRLDVALQSEDKSLSDFTRVILVRSSVKRRRMLLVTLR
ncbi:hypothetical protein ADUPG1_000453 [Aduncisulcus paluster]|uniref:Uncharacterized protein n=1 Tax=Aduncisulcus paluster TaxID=2918883 RepID=A0ABQ5K6E5_9EUKA|nr:hypothetical protein ADUPG1_000453 [Aduncisulcus paluster]